MVFFAGVLVFIVLCLSSYYLVTERHVTYVPTEMKSTEDLRRSFASME